jgi:lysophospholipase L1-like esterase
MTRPLRSLLAAALTLTNVTLLSPRASAAPEINPARWQARVDRYLNVRDKQNPPAIGGVVFTGSSSIDMWVSLKTDFPKLDVVNRGIGGTWLADLPHFAPELVYPLKPRIVVVYSGENDLQDGRTVEQVVAAFKELRDQIHTRAPGAPIVFLALKPSPSRRAILGQMREANNRIAELCGEDPLCTFVDVFTPMLNAQGEPRPEIFSKDNLHMNAEGYRLWTKLVAPVLERLTE